jgi:hypothetical protein
MGTVPSVERAIQDIGDEENSDDETQRSLSPPIAHPFGVAGSSRSISQEKSPQIEESCFFARRSECRSTEESRDPLEVIHRALQLQKGCFLPHHLESQTSGTKQEREEREQMDERTLEEDEEAKEQELSVCHAACCSSDAAGETNRDRDGIQTEVRCNAREGRKGGDDEAEDGGGGGGDVVGVMEEDEEGWRWRKYGRKRVPGRSSSADAEGAPARGELRHYYRCAVEGCPARRQVETRGTQVVLRRLQGQHNHAGASSRRAQVQTQAQLRTLVARLQGVGEARLEVRLAEGLDAGPDGWRWRKYGQKRLQVHAGRQRAYYRCAELNCPAKKHFVPLEEPSGALLLLYQGLHTHPPPPASDSDAATVCSSPVQQQQQQQQQVKRRRLSSSTSPGPPPPPGNPPSFLHGNSIISQ